MEKRRQTIDIIFSVLASIILWVYVISIVNPQTTAIVRQVSVSITDIETLRNSGLALTESGDIYIDVEVTGQRNEVQNLTAKDIGAAVSVAALTEGENTVPVTLSLPSGISCSNNDLTVKLTAEEYVTQSKPVSVDLSGAAEGTEVTLIKKSLSQIIVGGAKSVVDNVASVRVSADISSYGIDNVASLTLATQAVDVEGNAVSGAELSMTELSISAAVYQTKTVPLEVPVSGSPWKGASIGESIIPETITIKGPAASLSQISSVKTRKIDIEGIYEDASYELDPVLPSGVYAAKSCETMLACFVISDTGSLEFTYDKDDLVISGLGDGLSATVDSGIGITAVVTGPVSALRTLAAGDVAPSVDVTGRTAGYSYETLKPVRTADNLTVEYSPATMGIKIKED